MPAPDGRAGADSRCLPRNRVRMAVPPVARLPAEDLLMIRLSHRLRIAALLVLAIFVLAMVASRAQAQPALTAAVPGAVAPGKTTEVTLSGAKLDQPLRIWTSFPAQ